MLNKLNAISTAYGVLLYHKTNKATNHQSKSTYTAFNICWIFFLEVLTPLAIYLQFHIAVHHYSTIQIYPDSVETSLHLLQKQNWGWLGRFGFLTSMYCAVNCYGTVQEWSKGWGWGVWEGFIISAKLQAETTSRHLFTRILSAHAQEVKST